MNNSKSLLIASFLTLIAAGMGFAIRGGILNDWGTQFGFSKGELGGITGGGLTGFGVMILICSLIVDKVGYKKLLVLAFSLHVLSAVITIAAAPVYARFGKDATYECLWWGMFLFALGNGMCESVINPLVATLYSKQKTHYLNILHAGWPGGLILGAVLATLFTGGEATIKKLDWEISMSFFLIPTIMYGIMVLKNKFPESEASSAGLDFASMLSVFKSPILWCLLVLHAMIGYVELGTDSWITNIMHNTIPGKALFLFIYTSALMFVLRFFAGPIVERINPLGLLFVSSVLGAIGLYMLGSTRAGIAIIAAATIYGIGKTFLWPTILGVVGERYPQGGALVMGAMGGVGMLSAGLLGGPGIGYQQDLYASRDLKKASEATYERYVAKVPYSEGLQRFVDETEKKDGQWPDSFGKVVMKEKNYAFLGFLGIFPKISGLDGTKVGALETKASNVEKLEAENKPVPRDEQLTPEQAADYPLVHNASIEGGQMALKLTALVPATMAIGFLLLVIYFRATGGYKQETLHTAPYNAPSQA